MFSSPDSAELLRYLSLKLAVMGQPLDRIAGDDDFVDVARPLLRNYENKVRLLKDYLCPADTRFSTSWIAI